jgi:hypothetical protein
LLVLSDEASRPDSQAAPIRAQRARLDPAMCLERWDESAPVRYDKAVLNELVSLRFLQKRAHVTIVGPVGVGKTFLANALGPIACRPRHSSLALRSDQMLKTLRHPPSITTAKSGSASASPLICSSSTTSLWTLWTSPEAATPTSW